MYPVHFYTRPETKAASEYIFISVITAIQFLFFSSGAVEHNYPRVRVVRAITKISLSVPPSSVMVRKTGDSSEGSDVISGSAGDDFSLECVATGGNPAPRLSWRMQGQEVRAEEVQEDSRQTGGRWVSVSRLTLPVSHEDNGARVQCLVSHDALDTDLLAEVSFNIYYPPRVSVRSSRDTLLAEGDSVTLSCDVQSNPPSSVTWRKLEKNTRIVSDKPSFTISSVSRTSAGSYQCLAENELGRSQPETIVLDVQCKFIKTSPIQIVY